MHKEYVFFFIKQTLIIFITYIIYVSIGKCFRVTYLHVMLYLLLQLCLHQLQCEQKQYEKHRAL